MFSESRVDRVSILRVSLAEVEVVDLLEEDLSARRFFFFAFLSAFRELSSEFEMLTDLSVCTEVSVREGASGNLWIPDVAATNSNCQLNP